MTLVRQATICQHVAVIMFKHPLLFIFVLSLVLLSGCAWFGGSEDASFSRFPKHHRLFSSFGRVVEITDGSMENLTNLLKENSFAFVLFYAPWCGQSWSVAQEFNRAAKMLFKEVSFIAINCWTGTCSQKNKVDVFPKLVGIHTSFDGVEYKGMYKASKMVGFMDSVIRPFVYIGTYAELAWLRKSCQELVIGYFNQTVLNNRNYTVFFTLALHFASKVSKPTFAVVTNEELALQAGVNRMSGVVYHRVNQPVLTYPSISTNYTVTALVSWIDANRCELVARLTSRESEKEHLVQHLSKGPALILFLPIKQRMTTDNQQMLDTYVQVASQYFNCPCDRTSTGTKPAITIGPKAAKNESTKLLKPPVQFQEIVKNVSHFAKFVNSEMMDVFVPGKGMILPTLRLGQDNTCQSIQLQRESEFQGNNKLNICDICHSCKLGTCRQQRRFGLRNVLNVAGRDKTTSLPTDSCSTLRPSSYSGGTTSVCCTAQRTGAEANPTAERSPLGRIETVSLKSLRQSERNWDDIFDDILLSLDESFGNSELKESMVKFESERQTLIQNSENVKAEVSARDDSSQSDEDRPTPLNASDGVSNNTCVRTGHVTQFLGAGCYSNRSVNFFVMDSTESWSVAENLGVVRSPRAKVALVIADLENDAQFVLDESIEITNFTIVDFVMGYMAGNLTRRFRSGRPMPRECPSSRACVIEVVTSTFEEIVLDETKDVLLLYYTPWCGFCHALGPVLLTVARYFQDMPDVVIARINTDENDLPWELYVTHYPSFILFPANRKDFSIRFPDSLERTAANLVQFVFEHGGRTAEVAEEYCVPEGVREKISELGAALQQVEEEKKSIEVILEEVVRAKELWKHRRAVAIKGLKEAERELTKEREMRLAAEFYSKNLEQKQKEAEEKVLKLVAGSARVLGDLEAAEARLSRKEQQLNRLAIESRRILLEKDEMFEKLKEKESALRGQRKTVLELHKSVTALRRRVTLLEFSNSALRLKLRNSSSKDLQSDHSETVAKSFPRAETAYSNTDEVVLLAEKNSGPKEEGLKKNELRESLPEQEFSEIRDKSSDSAALDDFNN